MPALVALRADVEGAVQGERLESLQNRACGSPTDRKLCGCYLCGGIRFATHPEPREKAWEGQRGYMVGSLAQMAALNTQQPALISYSRPRLPLRPSHLAPALDFFVVLKSVRLFDLDLNSTRKHISS